MACLQQSRHCCQCLLRSRLLSSTTCAAGKQRIFQALLPSLPHVTRPEGCFSSTCLQNSFPSCLPSSRPSSTSSGKKLPDGNTSVNDDSATDVEAPVEKLGLWKRFHQTYKQHGKILICVHVFTSAIWASSFYGAAVCGVDVIPLLKWLGASERLIAPFTTPGVGHAATTFLMYKLATPIRYTVTIASTHFTVRYMRRRGYLPKVSDNDRIRSMLREKVGEVRSKEPPSK